jgi:hypothetical protein
MKRQPSYLFRLALTGLVVLAPGVSHTGEVSGAVDTKSQSGAFSFGAYKTLRISTGTTYNYISQSFYETIADTALDLGNQINQEYLNQPGAYLSVIANPLGDRRLQFESYVEQSSEYFRGRFNSDVALRSASDRFTFSSSLEIRRRTKGQADIGDEYVLGRARVKWSHSISKRIQPFVSIRGEFNSLNNANLADSGVIAFGNGYQRIAAQGGLGIDIGKLDRLTFSGSFETRVVSTDTSLAYRLGRVEVEYTGFLASSFYSLDLSLDNRNYNVAGDDNDQSWLRLGGNAQFDINGRIAIEPRFSVEGINYRLDTSSFNLDQTRIEGQAKFLVRAGSATIGIGPRFEAQTQAQALNSSMTPNSTDPVDALDSALLISVEDLSEEYFETATVISFEYFTLSSILVNLENQFGLRDYDVENSFQTDYAFNRLSLFSTVKIAGNIKFDIIGSIEWEWHDQQFDNNTFYLLNSSLGYSF